MFTLIRIAVAIAFAMLAALICSVIAGGNALTLVERLVFFGGFTVAYVALGNWCVQQLVSTIPGVASPAVSVPDAGEVTNGRGDVIVTYNRTESGSFNISLTCRGYNFKRFFGKGGLKRSLAVEGVSWNDPHTTDKRNRVREMTGVAGSAQAVHSLILLVETSAV